MDDTTIYVIFSIIGVLVAGPILFLLFQRRPLALFKPQPGWL